MALSYFLPQNQPKMPSSKHQSVKKISTDKKRTLSQGPEYVFFKLACSFDTLSINDQFPSARDASCIKVSSGKKGSTKNPIPNDKVVESMKNLSIHKDEACVGGKFKTEKNKRAGMKKPYTRNNTICQLFAQHHQKQNGMDMDMETCPTCAAVLIPKEFGKLKN